MNPADNLTVHLFDTANGLRVTIADHTTHTSGSMTASAANVFGNEVFDPNATCLKPLGADTNDADNAGPSAAGR